MTEGQAIKKALALSAGNGNIPVLVVLNRAIQKPLTDAFEIVPAKVWMLELAEKSRMSPMFRVAMPNNVDDSLDRALSIVTIN